MKVVVFTMTFYSLITNALFTVDDILRYNFNELVQHC